MKLDLEQASKDSGLSCQDLLDHIDAGRLRAERKAVEDRTEYLIDADELSRFVRQLKTSTLFLQPDMQIDDPLPASGESSSGNLRRVLTAESVAELKIEHKVLSARVETLERLFSEFMEAEREEQTLVLEDGWKIDNQEPTLAEANHELNDTTDDNAPYGTEKADVQPAAQMIPDAVTTDTVNAQAPQPEPSEPKTAAEAVTETALDANITANGEDSLALVDETKAVDVADAKDDYKKEVAPLDAKALLRDKLVSAKTDEYDEPKAEARSDEQTIEFSDIDVRLAEYERRLAEAKQTATQMWH